MDWQATLTKLVGLTAPVGAALRAGTVKSAAEAFGSSALFTARQAIVAELRRHATLTELVTASAELRRQHEELALKPELSAEELQRLGVLSGTALALSAEALGQALSEQELFALAVTQIGPWLARAADCGIVKLPASARALYIETGAVAAAVTRALI